MNDTTWDQICEQAAGLTNSEQSKPLSDCTVAELEQQLESAREQRGLLRDKITSITGELIKRDVRAIFSEAKEGRS